jgi:hypothetical protein
VDEARPGKASPDEASAGDVQPGDGSGGPPVFVLGCPRSGTTLLRLCLDSHPNVSCGPETHFLADLERMTEARWRNLRRFGLSRADWMGRLAALVDGFQGDYARSRGKRRWADKTPAYTLSVDFIDALFPEALFLHIVRDAHDVVQSHRERWGYRAALRATAEWPTYVRAAHRAGARLGDARYLELRYEALVESPEPTLRRVFAFLGEPWDPRVLDYRSEPHDRGPQREKLQRRRREEGGDPGAIYRTRVGAARLDPFLRTLLWWRAGDLRRSLGEA